jgi:hypothetical protein
MSKPSNKLLSIFLLYFQVYSMMNEQTCNESEMGKASKWLFGALEKVRNATMEKQIFNIYSKHKEEYECKKWKGIISVHTFIKII